MLIPYCCVYTVFKYFYDFTLLFIIIIKNYNKFKNNYSILQYFNFIQNLRDFEFSKMKVVLILVVFKVEEKVLCDGCLFYNILSSPLEIA